VKRRQVDSKKERIILTAMITSKPFLASVLPVMDLDLIEADHFRQIASWCIDYYRTYQEPPKRQIETLFFAWAEAKDKDDEKVAAIHDFLEHLSKEYDAAEDINLPYLLDMLSDFLALKKIARVQEDLEYALIGADRKAAETAIQSYESVNLGQGCGIDILNDRAAWDRTFSNPLECLIPFSGKAGDFFNKAFVRDALVGIQGPEKRGKTFWCVELVMRALRNRKKVALFEVGDLSESQIMLRFGARAAALPLWPNMVGTIDVPCELIKKDNWREEEDNGRIGVEVSTSPKVCEKVVHRRAVLRGIRRTLRDFALPRRIPYSMVSVHPNSSINVAGISAILQRWETEQEFIPDVIIIDYADILAPEDPKKQARDQVNDTWKALRRLSQERHCLVIAPTQADAASYDVQIQTMKNFSEDKRKLAHVTGMLGLNQTDAEKQAGVMRLNWIVLRESEFSVSKPLYVGQCLALGRAYCCSTF
jgi:hypothetical protein